MVKPAEAITMPAINPKERHFALRVVAGILRPLVRLSFRLEPTHLERLPKQGAFILVSNHVTNVDALAVAYLNWVYLKRAPHFLAKEGLFRTPLIGRILLAAGQIPVFRTGRRNDEPLRVALKYLEAGHVITVFPEGTLTRNPDLWPMRGKTGAVRLALAANVPVYPVAHWGSEKIMGQYSSVFKPGFWKPVRLLVGNEIDLSEYRNEQNSPAMVVQATEKIMWTITGLVEELRGEKAPAELWDPAEKGQAVTGNYKKSKTASGEGN